MLHEACGASASPNLRSRTAASVQGSAKRRAPDLVNFVPVVAHHFCLALPAAFTQPGAQLLAHPCNIQGSAKRRFPGCVNAAGKARQKG